MKKIRREIMTRGNFDKDYQDMKGLEVSIGYMRLLFKKFDKLRIKDKFNFLRKMNK